MPLAPDDPARAKIAELRAKNATKEEIMEAMDTFEVPSSVLIRALSPGHAKLLVGQLLEHMVTTHLDPGVGAISTVGEPTQMEWLDGPLFGGEMHA